MSAKQRSSPAQGRAMGRQQLGKAALIFAALGDATRLRLVARLSSDGPMSIARLTRGGSVTRHAVTKHLQALASVGLACSSRLGRGSRLELAPEPLDCAPPCLDRISAQ